MNGDYLKNLLNIFATSPEVTAQFDVVKLLAYISSLENIPGLENFRRDPAAQPNQPGVPTNVPSQIPSPAAAQRGVEPRANAASTGTP